MALWNNAEKKNESPSQESIAKQEPNLEQMLEGYEGAGLDEISPKDLGTSYLSIVAEGSKYIQDFGASPGQFIITPTGEIMGDTVDVILYAVKKVWVEKDAAGMTVGMSQPGAINVDVTKGSNGYDIMKSTASGNAVNEQWSFAVAIAAEPSNIVLFTPGLGSKQAVNKWLKLLTSNRFDSGKIKPIFSNVWTLSSGPKMSKTTKKNFYAFTDVSKKAVVSDDVLKESVIQNYLLVSKSPQMLLQDSSSQEE